MGPDFSMLTNYACDRICLESEIWNKFMKKIEPVTQSKYIISFCSLCYIDGLVQERRNSSALAMELRMSCTNPSIYAIYIFILNKLSMY